MKRTHEIPVAYEPPAKKPRLQPSALQFPIAPGSPLFDPEAFMEDAITDEKKEQLFWLWFELKCFSKKQEQNFVRFLESLLKGQEEEREQGKICGFLAMLYLFSRYRNKIDEEKGKAYLSCMKQEDLLAGYISIKLVGKHNREEELALYIQATENPSVYPAIYNMLGLHYLNADGELKDYPKAREYFEKGLENNNLVSLYALGRFYWEAWGVEKDCKKALAYFTEAAAQGHPDALGMLERHYMEDYVQTSQRKSGQNALIFMEQAALQRIVFCMDNCAAGFQRFGEEEKAEHYFKMAIDHGNFRSYFNLGKMYLTSKNFMEKRAEGYRYMKMAAAKEQLDALDYLKDYYLYCDSPESEEAKQRFFEKHPDMEQTPEAYFFYLGFRHEHGLGIPVNIWKAFDYYRQARRLSKLQVISNKTICEIHGLFQAEVELPYIHWWEDLKLEPIALLHFLHRYPVRSREDSPEVSAFISVLEKAGCYDLFEKLNLSEKEPSPTEYVKHAFLLWNQFCEYQAKRYPKDSEQFFLWSMRPVNFTRESAEMFKDLLARFPNLHSEEMEKRGFLQNVNGRNDQFTNTCLRPLFPKIESGVEDLFMHNRFLLFSHMNKQKEQVNSQEQALPTELVKGIAFYMYNTRMMLR
jgi:TPR repeat protein